MPNVVKYANGNEVPDHLIQQAIAEGKAQVSANATFTVANVDGTTKQVTGAELPSHMSDPNARWRVLSNRELQELEQRRESQSVTGKVRTGAAGLARGLTLGGSDVALTAAGADPSAIKRDIEENPTLAATTEVAGAVAPVIASGGAGAGAAAARVAPAALVSRGAAAVGRVAEGALARRGVSQGLARGAGMVAEGAVEGGIAGAGMAFSDAAIEDKELTGEELVASMGAGALLGGGLGLGLAAGAGGLKKLGQRAARLVDDVPGQAALPEAEGFAGKTTEKLSRLSAKVIGDQDGNVVRAGGMNAEGRRIRSNVIREQELQQEFVEGFSKDVDDMLGADRAVRDIYAGETKTRNVAKAVRRGDDVTEGAQRFTDDLLQDTEDLAIVRALDTGDTKFASGTGKRGKRLREWVQRAQKAGHSSEEQAFIELDKLRRNLFQESKNAARAARQSGDPDKIRANLARSERADALGQRVRSFLEDQTQWGDAAAQQAKRNALGSEAFDQAGDFGKRFESRTSERESAEHWQTNKRVGDRRKVESFARQLTDYTAARDVEQTFKALDARVEQLDALLKQGDVPANETARVTAARDAAAKARSRLQEFQQVKQDADLFRQIEQQEGESMIGGMLPGGGVITGGLLGGGAGAVLGAAAGVVARPSRALRKLATIESIAARKAKVQGKITRSASKAVTKAQKPVTRRTRTRVPASAAVVVFGSTPEKRRSRYKRQKRQIDAFVQNPQLAMEHVQKNVVGDLAHTLPATAVAVAQQHGRALQYLSAKLPAATLPAKGFQPQLFKREPTDAEIERFARYSAAVADPLSVLDDMRHGNLSTEAVEAVREVYPRLYQEMRLQVMAKLGEASKPLVYRDVLQISLLLDVPGHPTLDPEFIAQHQQRLQQQQQEQPAPSPPSGGGSPELAPMAQTPSQRIAQG